MIHILLTSTQFNAHMFLCGEADLRGYQPASKGNGGESEDHWYKYTATLSAKRWMGACMVEWMYIITILLVFM